MARLNLPKQRTAIAKASILKRFIAFLIDLLIIQLIVISPFRKIVESLIGGNIDFSKISQIALDMQVTKTLTGISIAIGTISVLYFVIFEYKLKQTPGKILFNIYVVPETGKLLIWQSIVRSLFLIPVFPFILLWIIDPLFLLLSKTSQRLTEQLSKTLVVERVSY